MSLPSLPPGAPFRNPPLEARGALPFDSVVSMVNVGVSALEGAGDGTRMRRVEDRMVMEEINKEEMKVL